MWKSCCANKSWWVSSGKSKDNFVLCSIALDVFCRPFCCNFTRYWIWIGNRRRVGEQQFWMDRTLFVSNKIAAILLFFLSTFVLAILLPHISAILCISSVKHTMNIILCTFACFYSSEDAWSLYFSCNILLHVWKLCHISWSFSYFV